MFTIRYSVLNHDTLTTSQRALYEHWQEITEETLTERYGPRETRRNTLRIETDKEAKAREAYEESMLTDHDRLILRIGHFVEEYWQSLGPGASDCTSIYEVEYLNGWSDIVGNQGRLFDCYLRCGGNTCTAKVLYLPATDTLEIIRASTDWTGEED